MNLNEITISPPLKFRAIHKETKREGAVIGLSFDYEGKLETVRVLLDVSTESEGFYDVDEEIWVSAVCDIDLFIGHTDDNDQDLHAGDIVSTQFPSLKSSSSRDSKIYYWLIYWDKQGCWRLQSLMDNPDPSPMLNYLTVSSKTFLVGSIHNLAALPEKVRNMLK
jgi:hypothetical protein